MANVSPVRAKNSKKKQAHNLMEQAVVKNLITRLYLFPPVCQSGQFANRQIGQPTICKLRCTICQLSRNLSYLQIVPTNFISQHEKMTNVGRQQSGVLSIVISVNIFHKRRLPLMLVLCHNLCRVSSFNKRHFIRNH